MAIKNKSKMGSMMGIDLGSVTAMEEPTITTPQERHEPESQPKQHAPAAQSSKIYSGGKPKFELIAGAEEKKINFHFPKVLYDFICGEARKQEKSAKQFISEILLEEMSDKYNFKVE